MVATLAVRTPRAVATSPCLGSAGGRVSGEPRVIAFVAIAGLLVLATTVYVGIDFSRAEGRSTAAPKVATTSLSTIEKRPHIVFRNTETGSKYGLVSMVGLDDPAGPRAFTTVVCDRVYATADDASCLRTRRGIATTFQAQLLDRKWRASSTWALPGIPSRTRLSADGSLVATTTFVSGHSYMQTGFSTSTEIKKVGGSSYGNLESFALLIDGHKVKASDRNIWGVTFGVDNDTFYATAESGGTTYLVKGDLAGRTLTSIRTTAECPSLSPDGSRIAYKKAVGGSPQHWSIAVLDMSTGVETILRGESRSVDDQVEWLDDDSLLYGLPRSGEAGVSDVWNIRISPTAKPVRFIADAWSPSVVRR